MLAHTHIAHRTRFAGLIGVVSIFAMLWLPQQSAAASDANYCDSGPVSAFDWCWYGGQSNPIVHTNESNYASNVGSGSWYKCAALDYTNNVTYKKSCSYAQPNVCYSTCGTSNTSVAFHALVANWDNNAHNMYGHTCWGC